jgi:hypothetical protein
LGLWNDALEHLGGALDAVEVPAALHRQQPHYCALATSGRKHHASRPEVDSLADLELVAWN